MYSKFRWFLMAVVATLPLYGRRGKDYDPAITVIEGDCGRRTASRIIGGRTAEKNDFPWAVALVGQPGNGSGLQFCGGTLITDRHVVTAAHCVIGLSTLDFRVHAGHVDLDDAADSGGEWVSSIIVHPEYDSGKHRYADIAIVKLRSPIARGSGASACCLSDTGNHVGRNGTVLGWGATTPNGELPSKRLRYINLTIMANAECEDKLKRRIPSGTFCAGGLNRGFDSCTGDSGGPLVVLDDYTGRYSLAGIVSHGPLPCDQESLPSVYTQVRDYRDWVMSNAV
ncbi:proclotting enzyme-like [Tropilaelaps mercedesae]|uniref:Proclotting enzyme-like n=1 Tax=Tropilaelaps mercedesae TaxID=418985 RepID=A0A1V9X6U7_9ACAR|nr:proclotting enzyme-like [Tropilaelaps mercedesae]